MTEFTMLHFISEPVLVHYDRPPLLEKTPTCPQGFTWREETFVVVELVSEWRDYQRRGRFARNMQPQHAAAAAGRGSWGVGQFYFRVRTAAGRYFDLYYDRAPQDAGRRKGGWFLDRELAPAQQRPED